MIPCKDCLVYPACKLRVRIICPILYRYLDQDNYDEVKKFLPNVLRISIEAQLETKGFFGFVRDISL